MVTLDIAKKILNSGDRKYSDDDIRRILQALNSLAEIDLFIIDNNFLTFKSHKNEKESSNLR